MMEAAEKTAELAGLAVELYFNGATAEQAIEQAKTILSEGVGGNAR